MSGESVEQAALRRAAHDELPAPFGSIFAAIDAVASLNDARFRDLSDRYRYVCDTNAALEVQVSEQADAILALSNRIENLTGTVTAHHGRLAQMLGHTPLDDYNASGGPYKIEDAQ